MYEDFYDELSEFEMQIEEWKDTLKKEIKEEYQEKMKKLEEENSSLRDIKKNWQKKVEELEREKRKAEIAIRDAEQKAKKERISELLDSISEQVWGYKYSYGYIFEKCDKCDEDGYIHYKSPQGHDRKEQCDCRIRMRTYKPEEAKVVNVKERNNNNIKLVFSYNKNDFDDFDTNIKTERVYNGEDFETIDTWYGMIFFDKDDCQRFCDYLNAKEMKKALK